MKLPKSSLIQRLWSSPALWWKADHRAQSMLFTLPDTRRKALVQMCIGSRGLWRGSGAAFWVWVEDLVTLQDKHSQFSFDTAINQHPQAYWITSINCVALSLRDIAKQRGLWLAWKEYRPWDLAQHTRSSQFLLPGRPAGWGGSALWAECPWSRKLALLRRPYASPLGSAPAAVEAWTNDVISWGQLLSFFEERSV